jgi:hypothetical protein
MIDLQHVMERVGRIVAADQLLKVDVRGVKAFAVKGRVVLPAIENYDWLGEHAGRMLHGLLDHECGHASFTDFEVIKRIVAEETPAFKALWNALEDGMVERLKGAEYRGCAQNIEQLHDWYWEHGGDGNSPISEVIASHPDLWTAFCLGAHTVVAPYGGHPIATIEELHTDAGRMLREVEAELAKVATATTTEEIFAITKTIYEWFTDVAEPPKPEPEPEESDEDEDGGGDTRDDEADDDCDAEDPSDDVDDDDADDADDDGDDSRARQRDAEPEEDDTEEDTAGEGGGSEDQPDDGTDATAKVERSKSPIVDRDLERWTRDGTPLNPEDAIQVRVRSVFEQPRYVQPYTVFSHEFDLVRDFSAENVVTGNQFAADMKAARAASEPLAIAFESALRAKRDLRAVGGFDEGLVDPDLLGEFAVGACPVDQLYQQYVAEDSDDVAVSILLDCSGSMGNGPKSKSHLAKVTALALHQALASCQIEHEITGFTTYESHYANRWVSSDDAFRKHAAENMDAARAALKEAEEQGTDISKFARIYRMIGENTLIQVPVYGVFKSFGATDARGLENVAGLSHNLDGEAVLWQAKRLAKRAEKRRVMFVLSDGQPEGSIDNAQGALYLTEAVQRVLASGIEIYGIGMDSAAVRTFYPEHWVCSDMQDLGRLAMTAMTDVLLRSRMERQWVRVA